jgi:hypothetical protein
MGHAHPGAERVSERYSEGSQDNTLWQKRESKTLIGLGPGLSELRRTPLWRSSRQRESLHSYAQIVLGAPDEGYSVITTARPSS